MPDYHFQYDHFGQEISVIVTEEAWEDKDCLNRNKEIAYSVASAKIAAGKFMHSEDSYRTKYILITSADTRDFH